MEQQLREHGLMLGRYVATISPDAILGFDMVGLENLVQELGRQPDMALAAITDAHGRPLSTFAGLKHKRGAASQADDSSAHYSTDLLRHDLAGDNLLRLSFPILYDDELLGHVILVLSRADIQQRVEELIWRQFVIGLMALVLISAALFFGFRLQVLGPLGHFMAAAQRVARGDYSAPVEKRSGDELGRLADTLNRMMRAILEKETQLEKITRAVEQSSASVVITDAHGAIEYVNPKFSQVTGYDADEAIGLNPRILKSGHMDPSVYEEMWRALKAGQTWRGEIENRAKDGRLFWESASISPIFSEEGEITHYIAVKDDITQRLALERELRQAKERAEASSLAKSEFLALMSHEIRTPMNAILGMAELLNESPLNDEQRELLTVQTRAANNLLELINEILDLSRIEAGRMELVHEPFRLDELVEGIVSLFRQKALEKSLALSGQVEPSAPPVLVGDASRLRQVLINLVGNAIKFTKEGGVWLDVSVQQEFDEERKAGPVTVSFRVADSGPGIPKGVQGRIFQPFTQASAYVTREHGGTGLGLSICQRLVDLFDGRIWVESEPGKGSTFQFTARLTLPDPADLSRPAPERVWDEGAEAPMLDRPLRILLAEDMPDNALLVRSYLKHTPYQVDVAIDGVEALELFNAGQYHLVLMDMQMPVMDGYSAVREIRLREYKMKTPRTPILALTAHALRDEAERSLAVGCDDHLTKPIRKQTLMAAIAQYAVAVEESPAASADPEQADA
ncbi:putative PAS/PAC sensor hybrid histidine kinase [Magnetofaba australis IT-1]|uniref:Sensory/regulatory protein RpfC n=2 Tax=Magnetofaba TaxID=1472292 RepID=A0A1Y2K8T3_9PROT|nr:putative PAS/PAC sensor hybrid histidine kinase [Magnetofaba australis IT-1]